MAESANDLMSPEHLHETLRGLVAECYAEKDGLRKAVKAMAVVHLVGILDVMLTAGHPLPSAWTQPQPHDTNAG